MVIMKVDYPVSENFCLIRKLNEIWKCNTISAFYKKSLAKYPPLIVQKAVIRKPRFKRPMFIYIFFLLLQFCAPSIGLATHFMFTLLNVHVRYIPDRDLSTLTVMSVCIWQFRYFPSYQP